MTSPTQFGDDDEDDDDISITSTPQSEPQDEYEVEDILAEKEIHGRTMYLVKWAGYSKYRSNWEPEESFCQPQILKDWAAKKEAIAQKKETAIDVESLLEKILAIEAATTLRKQRRKKKRIRLGLPVSPDNSEEDQEGEYSANDFDAIDDDDDVNEGHHRPLRSQKQPQSESQKEKSPASPGEHCGYLRHPAVDKPQPPTESGKKNASAFPQPSSASHTTLSTTSKTPSAQRKPPSTVHNVGVLSSQNELLV